MGREAAALAAAGLAADSSEGASPEAVERAGECMVEAASVELLVVVMAGVWEGLQEAAARVAVKVAAVGTGTVPRALSSPRSRSCAQTSLESLDHYSSQGGRAHCPCSGSKT